MLEPFFLETAEGGLFIQQFKPTASMTGEPSSVLLVPPFAEELNKSRRMIAELGRALAQHNISLTVPDLLGTGDSAGDFGEATLPVWQSNLKQVVMHMLDHGCPSLHLVGLRMGGLLAADLLREPDIPVNSLIFWQPMLSGKQMLNQFLRLRVAAGMMSGEKETISGLREQISQSDRLEVAGYEINYQLQAGLDVLSMDELIDKPNCPIHWFEIQSGKQQKLPIPAQKLHKKWQGSGHTVHLQALSGEAFWSTQEICEVPELIEHTVQALVAHHV